MCPVSKISWQQHISFESVPSRIISQLTLCADTNSPYVSSIKWKAALAVQPFADYTIYYAAFLPPSHLKSWRKLFHFLVMFAILSRLAVAFNFQRLSPKGNRSTEQQRLFFFYIQAHTPQFNFERSGLKVFLKTNRLRIWVANSWYLNGFPLPENTMF